jgi:hypothetical protein
MLLKVLVYAYASGTYSSRKIARRKRTGPRAEKTMMIRTLQVVVAPTSAALVNRRGKLRIISQIQRAGS